jgi:alanine-synthesizing transaminase
MIADTYLSMNAPVQFALPALITQRYSFHEQWRERVQSNLTRLDVLLASNPVCSRLQMEGGWYVVLKVPSSVTGEDLAIKLLQTRATFVHPGHFYDLPHAGYLVISLIVPLDEFSNGVQALLDTLQLI